MPTITEDEIIKLYGSGATENRSRAVEAALSNAGMNKGSMSHDDFMTQDDDMAELLWEKCRSAGYRIP